MEQGMEPNAFVLPPFEAFKSIPRLARECVVTEKIDGTNSCVYVGADGLVLAGSRNRWISHEPPAADNFSFARWVKDHEDELRQGLGVGLHHGEWWGAGIQRRYGMKEKRWSLFNTSVWNAETLPKIEGLGVVPVLYQGPFNTDAVERALASLALEGSRAAPGFMDPEGVVVYHVAAGAYFKQTLKGDGHKYAAAG